MSQFKVHFIKVLHQFQHFLYQDKLTFQISISMNLLKCLSATYMRLDLQLFTVGSIYIQNIWEMTLVGNQ